MLHLRWWCCEEPAATLGVGQCAGARERLQESSVWPRGHTGAERSESLRDSAQGQPRSEHYDMLGFGLVVLHTLSHRD